MNLNFSLIVVFFSILSFSNLQAQSPVTWTGASSNVQITGNTIEMTGGNAWAEGAYSVESIPANTEGYLEVSIQFTNKGHIFGLSIPPNENHHYATIDYGIFVRPDKKLQIYENGSKKVNNAGNYGANDILKVERIGETIYYYRNSNLLYTSQTASNTELIADASLRNVGTTVHNATLFINGGDGCNTTLYADTDNDGFGDPNSSIVDCTNPAGYVEDNTDCDDTDADINPNTVWYQDSDDDGYGNSAVSQTQCTQPNGYVLDNTDCDDITNDPNNDCGGGGGTSIWTQSGNDIRYSDGKVFIGDEALDISSDDYNLFVEKGIMTERLKVAIEGSGDWADYVFKKEYNRNSIEDVAKHIKEKGHLPNVPSAEAVANNGIDVAKMDATLLRQIEELWLHMIDLKKENENLKEEIKKLSDQ